MENTKLQRNANDTAGSVQSIIDELINEIENLELENEKLNSKVEDLENEIETLRDKLNDF